MVPRAIGTKLTTTAQTALFTAENQYAFPADLHVANVSAAAVWFTLELYQAANTTTYTLVYRYEIQPNSTGYHVSDDDALGFQMANGDILYGTAGTANALHAVLSVNELAGRSSG